MYGSNTSLHYQFWCQKHAIAQGSEILRAGSGLCAHCLLCSVILEDDGFSEKSLNLIDLRSISMPLDSGKYWHKFDEVA